MSLDAVAFIAALGLQHPIVVAHSMGGRNALLLTRRDPSRLRAPVMVDVGPAVSDRGHNVHGQNTQGFITAVAGFLTGLG